MLKTSTAIVLLLTCLAAQAASAPKAAPPALVNAVQDKNLPMMQILSTWKARALLDRRPELATFAAAYRARLNDALTSCASSARCLLAAGRMKADETSATDGALRAFCSEQQAECAGLAQQLRKTGTMMRFQNLPDMDLVVSAWVHSRSSVEHIFDVYGTGVVPRYPQIDSMAHDPQSEEFGRWVRTAVRAILAVSPSENAFYSDYVRFAFLVLEIDGRDEAGRHEPMEKGVNAAALASMRKVAWKRYPHSVILIPGIGPERPDVSLSAGSRMHVALAVERYRQGAAPFIIVSGGYVRPPLTPFSEALEMKRALIERYHIPERAILVDPHARHTTTGIRNAARLMYRYGMPFSMTGLIVTDEWQAAVIMGDTFSERNQVETGIVPYTARKLISPTEVEFTPSVDALQVGHEDPLDP